MHDWLNRNASLLPGAHGKDGIGWPGVEDPSPVQVKKDPSYSSPQPEFDRGLLDLVRLHLARFHECPTGIDQHSSDLRKQGEPESRLNELSHWWRSSLFSGKERFALSLAEGLTCRPEGSVTRILLEEAPVYFSREQLVHLVLVIESINDWNAINAPYAKFRAAAG